MRKIKKTSITISGTTYEVVFPEIADLLSQEMTNLEKENSIQLWMRDWMRMIEEAKPIKQRRKEKLLAIEKSVKRRNS